ncbi:MAG: hemolysin family protein, partial [Planctomycetes bacterium]|nr:hemolysin family protein [Planctomycetota bacterium]
TAATLMTPRQDIVWLDLAEPVGKLREIVVASGHTHYPVGRNGLTEVEGFLSIKTMFAHPEARTNDDLRRFLLEPLYVPNTVPALRLLETFKTARKHVALVVDEFGVVRGLVTVNDVLESLVGELPETLGTAESIVRREDGSWLVDGMVPLDRLKSHFSLGILPGEGKGEYQTLSGFVMTQLNRVPRTGDRFEWGGHQFEVIDMDETRVDKVLIQTVSKT